MSSSTDDNFNSKKFESAKLYFQVAQDEYRDELNRSQRLDEKVGRLLNFINFLLIGLVALCTTSFTLDFYKDLSNGLRFFSVSLVLALSASIGVAWFLLVQASGFTKVSKVVIDDQLSSWSHSDDPILLYRTLGDEYKYAIQSSEQALKLTKEKPIAGSILFLKLAVVLFFTFFILMFLVIYGAME